MKPQKLFLTALSLFILCTSLKCKKEKTGIDALPPITQEGKNTFGCLVNGKVLVPKGNGGGSIVPLDKDRNGVDYSIAMTDLSVKGNRRYLRLGIKKNSSNQFTISRCIYQQGNNNCEYEISPPISYNLTITRFDDAEAILSGTFAIDIPASDDCPAVTITDGRFDVKFYY